MNFHTLKIDKIVQETPDAVSIRFEIPAHLAADYRFSAGQHLTVMTEINGKEERRAYSLCTPPFDPAPTITVKKVTGGKMSTWLCEKVSVGDHLSVMTPEGHFVVHPDHSLARSHYFFAAGSGITPMMSMITTILEEEPKSVCYLLYGNRNESSVIFKQKLDELSSRYSGQLEVTHVLSKPDKKPAGGLGGLLGRKTSDWKGLSGRIDNNKCLDFINSHPSVHAVQQYYVCGPGSFIETVITSLAGTGIDKKNIHKEYFNAGTQPAEKKSGLDHASIKVTLRGQTFEMEVPKGKTILDVLVDAKKDPPYSCTSGACSTCMAKVTDGKVSMDSCFALDDDEVEAGYILTCQAHPQTASVTLSYDV